MRFDILTLFPEYFNVMKLSVIGNAMENGLISLETHDIRENSENKHKKTDDYPYGGGQGMVMTVQPVYDTYRKIKEQIGSDEKSILVYMSPKGKVMNQDIVKELACYDRITILCGHYEGMDQRVIDEIVDMELSIGDYVLTGGEIPAMVLVDSVSRLIPGVLAEEDGYVNESHYNGLLEYPQYTRPEEILGKKVPEVLLSGHHKNINRWRYFQSLMITEKNRPDMFEKIQLSDKVKKEYEKFKENEL
ncbi:MAG TPA: tRNA (guanosine(37)-N1)-methyltransferase TrmD [Clostridiales bacterium]|nr:tRNA (guanosine(37)-N1)-methyltransferase TrmD [Clostridiales bacterium]